MSIFSDNCDPILLVYEITSNVDIIYFGLPIIILSYDFIHTDFNNSFFANLAPPPPRRN